MSRVIHRHGGADVAVGADPAAYEKDSVQTFRATSRASHHEIRARAERKAPAGAPDRWRRRGEG
ncbi:hypothetical protein [Streptomyces sp. NPDC088350]|uniref:hypothetical protein n=1 Tax=Streptomyces sp. NPDC088350 TaxID=3365854 RepID=UPI0038002882